MNLYDKQVAKCTKCGKVIGEIEIGSKIVFLVCNKCKNESPASANTQKDSDYNFLNKRMIEITSS